MRQLVQSRGIRSVCYGLILALVATLAPTPLFVKPACAQLMPTYSVGIVDFVNESGVQGEALARYATDAVVVEMSKTNRYDVNITRSQIKSEMEKLSLRPPLEKLGIVRLGEALSADAMVEGSIKSVQLAGSGVTRRASVTLVVRMYDEASGEIINGAVQTGTSSARVGYVADDDGLISEAAQNAAFLAVKTMVDYIIPEATVQMNIGENQVMLNKGARDGIKSGMRMIVLRQKEIIGYIETRDVSPQDTMAKITKSMRGIQPEDKVRAIFEMPTVAGGAKNEQPLPSGAPSGTRGSRGSISKIGKFLLGAAIVFGLVSLFRGGRGNEDAPASGAGTNTDGIPSLRWDATTFGHGTSVMELQVLRDAFDAGAKPVYVVDGPTGWDQGFVKLAGIYGTGATSTVSYHALATNPAPDLGALSSFTVPVETFGTTHSYQLRVLYREPIGTTTNTGTTGTTGTGLTYRYKYSSLGAVVVATAIEPVKNADVVKPEYLSSTPPEVHVPALQTGDETFEWKSKDGADQYYMRVEPVVPGTAVPWPSSVYYRTGPTISLNEADRRALAQRLAATSTPNTVLRFIVFCKHSGDSNQQWVQGEENLFVINPTPPG